MRRASVRQDDVVRLEELTNTGPQPIMCNFLGTTLRYQIVEFGDRDLACNVAEVLKASGKLGDKLLHPNPREYIILDLRLVNVELKVMPLVHW